MNPGFHVFGRSDVVLLQYTVYERPRDYPQGYIVRCWAIIRGNLEPQPGVALTAATLEAARELIPQGLYRLSRTEGDDACIVETWV